jgi:hypothetical protein
MKIVQKLLAMAATGWIVLAPASVGAAVLTVINLNDTGAGSLRNAITTSSAGDTIQFGVTGTITLTSGELLIGHALTIAGPASGGITVSGNNSSRVFEIAAGVTVTISNLTISNGKAPSVDIGGAVLVQQGSGIYNGGSLTVNHCIISGNSAVDNSSYQYGGGIYNLATLTVSESSITGNIVGNGSAASFGAGIYNLSGTVAITNSTISGNSAGGSGNGGGIWNGGTVTITNSTLSGNDASNGGSGILNFGTVTITNSTISGNSSTGGGGGIFNSRDTAAVTITNCTLSGNSANFAGGIYNFAGTVNLTNSTISGNSAVDSGNLVGGIYNPSGGTVNARNTIIAKNTDTSGSPDFSGPVTSAGHNLIGNTTGSSGWGPTDYTGTSAAPLDPKFDPAGLKDNGGPTKTIALQPDSPAIDAGGSGGPATDQRGLVARPYDDPAVPNGNGSDGSDIGAFELGPGPAPVTNLNDSGPGSLRDTIDTIPIYFRAVVTFDPSLAGTIALATPLQINKAISIVGPGGGRIAISGNNVTRVIDVYSGALTLSGLKIVGGSDDGIRVHQQATLQEPASLTVNNCTISGNTTAGIYIEQGATVTVNNSTFSDNAGIGIRSNSGFVAVTNSTFTRNNNSGGGGAILIFGGEASVRNCTISGNSASIGAGIYRFIGGVTVSSSIIAGNIDLNGDPDVYSQSGTITSLGYNLIGNGSGGNGSFVDGVNHDQVGTTAAPIAPGLGPLQDNGGPTFTMALLSGSRALDQGISNGLTRDQRGSQRIYDDPAIPNPVGGGGADVGAFEFSPSPIVTTNAASNLGTSAATLHGSVNPNHLATSVHFEFGTTTSYGSVTSAQDIGNGTATLPVTATLSGLNAGTTYHFRAVASSVGGTVAGSDQVFTTLASGSLLNISTRMGVQTGDNVLIGGFIITGTDPKKVIIRGIGPSLAAFFSGSLADPTLDLNQGDTLLTSNDNWKTDQQAEIEATGIPPTNDLESAIVRTLTPGNYTAILRGKSDTTGIGVVEAYDLDQAANSRLANISTRGFVDTGDNVMIGGLIVGGTGGESAKVVLRALGPSLANFGVPDALQDPTLELHNADGSIIRSNDNWKDSQQTEIMASGLAPTDDRESAIVATLPPGNYTAIVRGKNSTTGVALVEVYNLQ